MREQSSSFEVARVVRELSKMVGARVRKAYQPHYEQVVLRLNRKGDSNRDLVIVRGKRVYTSTRDRPMPPNPSQFAMVLRKHLGNSRLVGVEQHGFDRVMILDFEHGGGKVRLVIELFRDGNIVLIDGEGVIIQPLTHANYASRSLKKGVEYVPPPDALDPRGMEIVELGAILDESDSDVIRTIASRANLGRVFGSAACSLAGIDEDIPANSLNEEQREALMGAITSMLSELEDGTGAILWLADNNAVSKWKSESELEAFSSAEILSPISLSHLDDSFSVRVESVSAALDGVFGTHDSAAFIRREEERLIESGSDEQQVLGKLERRAEQQRQAIGRFHQKAAVSQELGKAIQENWEHVNSILEQFNSAIEGSNWQSVAEKSLDIPWIGGVDPKKRTIVAYLPDEEGEPGTSITLEVGRTVHQNAQRYFENGRTQKEKAKGAQDALDRTEASQEREGRKAAKEAAAGRLRAVRRSRRFWFEKHRWAILSGGHFLIGGRDAKGNDSVVKKHLGAKDLYFHADLHGAPSCTLKLKDGLLPNQNPAESIPDGVASLQISQSLADGVDDARELPETIHGEAARISVCWSRAWGSGGAAATAFHVRPSQVSKTTESGESLGRGSFVVRGQRNWHRDLKLEIAIGMGVVNGVPMPVVGTTETISRMFGRWAKITPGSRKKEDVANSISKATGLTQDDVLSCLPPGNCSIEDHGLIGS